METRALQVVTNKLDAWAVERGLTFSPTKTVNKIFGKRNEEPMKITLRNQIIHYKKNTQFLRMTLDSRLRWKKHFDEVRVKKGSIKNYQSSSR